MFDVRIHFYPPPAKDPVETPPLRPISIKDRAVLRGD
jgi:hypothetical protein